MNLLTLWRNLVHRERIERELDDELQHTLAQLIAEKVETGMPPDIASRDARLDLNGIEPLKERIRQSRSGAGLESVFQDVRYAARVLWRSPSFSGGAILSLTLGLGATTLVFSIVNGFLLRPLPVDDPSRLVHVGCANESGPGSCHSYAVYQDLRQQNATLSHLAAFMSFSVAFDTGAGPSRRLPYFVSGNYFTALGIEPAFGRLLNGGDDRDGAAPVVVMDFDFWTTAYHANPAIIGTALRLSSGRAAGGPADKLYTVVGIAPREFFGTVRSVRPPAYAPLHALMDEKELTARAAFLQLFGRLSPGVTRAAAEENLDTLYPGIASARSRSPQGKGGALFGDQRRMYLGNLGWWGASSAGGTALEQTMRNFAGSVLLLAGLLLLTACANLATSLAARTIDRHREIAIRISLGANRWRVMRLMLFETMLLVGTGSVFGFGGVLWTTGLLSQVVLPGDPPAQMNVQPDGRVFAVVVLLAILSAVLSTVVPGRMLARLDPSGAIKGAPGLAAGRRWAVRDALIATQVVFSTVLLAACVMSLVGARRALAVPLGFQPGGLATATLDFDVVRYTQDEQRLFMKRAADQVRALPGVESVAYVNALPLASAQNLRFVSVPGRPSIEWPSIPVVYIVSDDYFQAMRIFPIEGRTLGPGDTLANPVVVVNQAFVRHAFPSSPAIGAKVSMSAFGDTPPAEIVGVVPDGKYVSLSESPRPAVFAPFLYQFGRPTLVVRSAGTEDATAAVVRQTIAALDPRLPIRLLGSAEDQAVLAFLPGRAAAVTLTGFGVVAILLTVTGLRSVVGYSIMKRRREIGVRLALGANATGVARVILGRMVAISGVAIAVGTVATIVLGRVLGQVVSFASSDEPLVLGGVAAMMLIAVLGAVSGPLIRCVQIAPAVALGSE